MRPSINTPEEDKATDVGNMRKELVKIASVGRRYPRGQTDRQTERQTYSSQYFATAPAGEVINSAYLISQNLRKQLCVYSVSTKSCHRRATCVPTCEKRRRDSVKPIFKTQKTETPMLPMFARKFGIFCLCPAYDSIC